MVKNNNNIDQNPWLLIRRPKLQILQRPQTKDDQGGAERVLGQRQGYVQVLFSYMVIVYNYITIAL